MVFIIAYEDAPINVLPCLLDAHFLMGCLEGRDAFLSLQKTAVVQLAGIKHHDLLLVFKALDQHVIFEGAVGKTERFMVLRDCTLVDLPHNEGVVED